MRRVALAAIVALVLMVAAANLALASHDFPGSPNGDQQWCRAERTGQITFESGDTDYCHDVME